MVMEGERVTEEGKEVEQHNNCDPGEQAERNNRITVCSEKRETLVETQPLGGHRGFGASLVRAV